MTITAERTYLKELDCCVYEEDGCFVYQDCFGYRTYKTRKGLENFIAKQKKMRGIWNPWRGNFKTLNLHGKNSHIR